MPQPSHFDVFLCHNSQDKPEVIKIAEQLKQQGLTPWLDVWELRPGLPWQPELERHIEQIKSAAVFVGESGIGPWQEMEIDAYLRQFVKKGSPVIPVLLSNAPAKPQLPIFLKQLTWVDFRRRETYPMEMLVWGITGVKEGLPKPGSLVQPYSPIYLTIHRRKILQWIGWGGVGLGAVGLYQLANQPKPLENLPNANTEKKLSDSKVEFQVLTVNNEGKETNRQTVQVKYFTEEIDKDTNFDMMFIPGGTFMMGVPDLEVKSQEDERPRRQVTVPDFYMGKFQVTQKLWNTVASFPKINRELNPDPSNFQGDDRPVETVNWYEAEEFCLRLSKKTQRQYRLPSEAEWEYACRAGTKTPFYFGQTITTDLANYHGIASKYEGKIYSGIYADEPRGRFHGKTTPVGKFPSNRFGLYDMHGNVWEWCADTWHNSYLGAPTDGSAWISENDNGYRILRGGSWPNDPRYCRSASRGRYNPGYRFNFFGFRVVCRFSRN